MQNKSAGVNPRTFNSMSVAGLSDEARKAVNAAFDAMSTWRIETANSSEKNSEQVIEKLAAAARALDSPFGRQAPVRPAAPHLQLPQNGGRRARID
jgi:TRAP-type C4-dicarboxylate transport system substrate-binding protein